MTSGVRQIVRFNWPFYAIAAVSVMAVAPAVGRLPVGTAGQLLLYVGLTCAAGWTIASLAASWIVYDASPLMRWAWIPGALGFMPAAWINVHAGLDQSTPSLRTMFAPARGRVFDIFDPAELTEPSIVKARRLARNAVEPEAVDFRHLPAPAGSADAVFLLLSAHELRTGPARLAFFDEIHRVLTPGGRVVIAEHLRDAANFAAFGPGFLHFHSRRTWTRGFAHGRFSIVSEFSITPFVRVFVLRRDA